MTRWTRRLAREAGIALAALGWAACASGAPMIITDARLVYVDPLSSLATWTKSNTVMVQPQVVPARIQFYTDDSFDRGATATTVGATLFLQADAPGCNGDPHRLDSVSIQLRSSLTGNQHTYLATETLPNSGVFRAKTDTPPDQPGVRSVDAGPAARPDDTVMATLGHCGGRSVQAWIMVDPSGVVFDRLSDTPVAGAQVTLVDMSGDSNGGRAGEAATVWDYDGVTEAPSTVTSDVQGRYSFKLVPPSRYRIDVVPPRPYSRSADTTIGAMPQGRRIAASASFGIPFNSAPETGPMLLDIPLEPLPRSISVQKTVSRPAVEVAESVMYTVTARNVGDVDFDDLELQDTLPLGFAFVPGSARMDGVSSTNPPGLPGRVLRFTAGPLASGQSRVLTYRAVARTAALSGDGINRVVARSTSPVAATSNEATAAVSVLPGVFTSDTTLLGVVFVDCNDNGTKDADEAGAPGIRLLMEDGTSVVTDGEGRYSLYGVSPRTHVLKIDRATLPAGAEPRATSQRHAGQGGSRFVDPRSSELHRADFALGGCGPALADTLRTRAASPGRDGELRQNLRTDLPLAASTPQDVKALPAAGTIGQMPSATGPRAPAPAVAASALAARAVVTGLAILDLADGAVLPQRPLNVRVQSRAGAPARLEIGSQPVGDDRIGERTVDTERGMEVREYVGLVLPAGPVTLALVQYDPFGNARERREVQLRVVGPLSDVRLSVPDSTHPSDGETRVPVTLALADRDGLPVAERHPVTLTASMGDWDVLDLEPTLPGVQTFTEGATTTWLLRAPATSGRASVEATLGARRASARTDFVAPLRPLVVAGVVEGVLNLRKLDRRSVVPAQAGDGFEQELRSFADHGSSSVNGRAAFFLKGKVRGDRLLTLGYDSDKDRRQRLFRDIQPDTFYPVYGDDSVKGFDAQSTGRLYVKLEQGKSYVLYGDLTTQSPTPARQLGAYQRSLTGLRVHGETERVTTNVFVSHDGSRQVVVELAANGTSGPFLLASANALPNSERVEVLVRDRNQPSRVLSSTPQVRFTDYDFEPFGGHLLFHGPVPSMDASLNPVSIRITYEVEHGGDKFVVAGGDVQVAVTDTLDLGGAVARDLDPLQDMTLASVNATWRPNPRTTVLAEAAVIDRDLGRGDAQRVELQHQDPAGLQARAFLGRSDTRFVNPSSSLSAGRHEAGVKASYPLTAQTRLTADALSSGDAAGTSRRDGVLVGVEHGFGQGSKVEVGLRWVGDHPAEGQPADTTRSVRIKAGTVLPWWQRVSVYGEAEQDVTDAGKRLLALGGEYQMANQGRVYLRHELISSLGGPFLLDPTQRRNTTVLGVDGDYMTDGRMFGEYRGRNAFGDRETEAAIGLRNRWRVADGVRLNTTVERVSALTGPATNDSLAVTGAVEYTADPLWKGTARLEARRATASNTFLSTLGLARKLDADWTMLGKNIYATTHSKDLQPTRVQERFQLGLAYRDHATNVVNGLSRYEFKREAGMVTGELARRVHSVSTHADWQADRRLVVTGMHAGKWVQEAGDGLDLNHRAHLLTARATRDVADRWDVGVALRLLSDGSFRNRQQGAGVETGYRVQEQMWVSVGYNASGFRDRDLAADRSTQKGLYLRLRVKFDESLLSGVSL